MCSKGKCLLKCCGVRDVPSTNTTEYVLKPQIEKRKSESKTPSQLEIPSSFMDIPKSLPDSGEMGDTTPKMKTVTQPETNDAATSIDKHIIKPKRKAKRLYTSTTSPPPDEGLAQPVVEAQPVKDTTEKQPEIIETPKSVSETSLNGSDAKKTKIIEEQKSVEKSGSNILDDKVNEPVSVQGEPNIITNETNTTEDDKSKKRGPQEIKYGFLLPPTRTSKLLLVFSQSDPVSEIQTKAAEKLGFEITFCNSEDVALEEFQSKSHDLVIIDTRSTKALDYDTLCRSIRNTKGSQHSVLVAVVRKSMLEKDDVAIMALLDSGFNRCIVENTNLIYAVNELIQLKHSEMKPMAQHATCQSVYAALDKCRDVVFITDDSYRCQYANRACEKYLNLRPEDVLGKTLQEQLAHDTLQITTMGSSLLRGREWNGTLTLKKKNQEPILASCKAIPITCAGRMPTHFVLILDMTPFEGALTQSRGSVHSIRRGSNDVRSVGSDFYRRTSLAKLNSLPLEAPITRIIGLIDQARENSGPNTQVVQILDRVEDILRCPELYSPQVKEDYKVQQDEPVVSDLITALLSKQPQPVLSTSSRRSSNDSSVYRPSKGGIVKVPASLRDLLDTSLSWEFDIFRLEDLTKKRPLQYLGMNLFTHFEVAAVLNCDEKTLYNWLIIIEANYHADNSYHNSTHAADVMQATAGFLEREKIKSIMDSLDEATSLIAAAAHDVDHPGRSNAFLSNSDNPLAIMYNDITILESHHAALMFKLTLGDERVNIFKNLDKETYKLARHNVIDMILATEMTKHFEHLAKFVNVFCTKPSSSDIELDSQDFPPLSLPENITLIKRMMIKCSDVSNPTRPLRLCIEWARRIAEEYFQQTDEEKERALPVVMPMFDRNTCSIPKSQIGFVDYIINDMFEAWNAFIDMPELITYMRQNYIRWKEFDEQGLNTLADINKIQSSVLMCPMFPSKTGVVSSD